MKMSMYQASVPVFVRALNNLAAILAKAEAHAKAEKIDPAVLVQARLYPDMLPLSKQIQIASDNAKGLASRLAGVEIPKFEDNESTLPELIARLRKTVDYLQTFKPEQIDGSEDKAIELPMHGGGVLKLQGAAYLSQRALPNVFFHCATAYAILRHNGIKIGKDDFLGK
ncbi:MAG: DUF1993 domain-containing protein [Chromatiales bacterium]|nr:DUF1993 domain-containing protein [Chromatiales bacterium]